MDCSLLRIVTKKRRDAFHECVLLHRVYKLKVQLNLNIQKLTRKPAFEVTNKVSLEMNALFSFSVIFMKAFFLYECVLLHRVYKLKVQLNLNIQKLTRKPAFEVTNKVSLEMNALFSFSVIFMKAFFLSIKSKL